MRRLGPALAGLALSSAAATACPVGLAVVRAGDGTVVYVAQAEEFSLSYRHSVTLTPVTARYVIAPDGTLTQTEERFAAHGPGLAHDGEGWRRDGDSFVLPLNREIGRLIVRTAPEHENRLIIADTRIDLAAWPREPLHLTPMPCEDALQ
jgi:hypothetical protein